MSSGKSQVVSVRVEPHIKEAMQAAADRELRSLANMFEVMVVAYCRDRGYPVPGVPEDALPELKSRKRVK